MGIWSSMLGRREPAVGFRTVDGGHPAPYPDMTDEQLYNYEIAFNVPRRTFDRPPPSANDTMEQGGWTVSDSRSEPTSGLQADGDAGASPTTAPDADECREPYSAAKGVHAGTRASSGEATPLNFERPVRTRTTRQPVDIITTRARHPVYKVHGYIGDDDVITVFTIDGRLSENGAPFLENVPEGQQLWINVYPNHDTGNADAYVLTQHGSREDADAAARAGRIACASLQFDL